MTRPTLNLTEAKIRGYHHILDVYVNAMRESHLVGVDEMAPCLKLTALCINELRHILVRAQEDFNVYNKKLLEEKDDDA